MDPFISSILSNLAVNYFVNFSTPTIKKFFQRAFELDPSLKDDLKNAKTTKDLEKAFQKSVGVIDAQAGTGEIAVDRSFLKALREIKFDHQDGKVIIQGSVLRAGVLETGGEGSGETEIKSAELKSKGTKIVVGRGASVRMTGNARIKQN